MQYLGKYSNIHVPPQVLSLLVRSGYSTRRSTEKLMRPDFVGLDFSHGAPPRYPHRRGDIVEQLKPSMAQLRQLDLTCASAELVDDAVVRIMVSGCQRLETLRLRGLPFITDETVAAGIAANVATLTWLDLSNCHGLSDECLQALSWPTGPSLRLLQLGNSRGFTSASMALLCAGASVSTLEV
jgi:hypothetical protein